jgi:hypothetical protein
MGWVSHETRLKVVAAYRGLAVAQRRLRMSKRGGKPFDPMWVVEAEKRVQAMKKLLLREAAE